MIKNLKSNGKTMLTLTLFYTANGSANKLNTYEDSLNV